MLLGIEIGGTKLQLGVGHGDGTELIALDRRAVDVEPLSELRDRCAAPPLNDQIVYVRGGRSASVSDDEFGHLLWFCQHSQWNHQRVQRPDQAIQGLRAVL